MASIYYDQDADPAIISGRRVAVIGYGSQGHAHALNLRESGVQVKVGLRETSRRRVEAEGEGLSVGSVAAVSDWADVVMVLVPDQHASDLYSAEIAPHLRDGDALMFAHGFNIHFGEITPMTASTFSWSLRRVRGIWCAVPTPRVRVSHACWPCIRMPVAAPVTSVSRTPGPSAGRGPACLRPPSRKKPRPTCSGNR